MKTYGTKTIPAVPETTKTVVTGCTCDLCGRQGDGASFDDDRGWGKVDGVTIRTKVSRKTGEQWPEGSHVKTQSFDVCPECWATKVVPWFASQGAKPTDDKLDY